MNPVPQSRQDAVETAGTGAAPATNVIDLLRRFHYGDPAAAARTDQPHQAVMPALLNPYRDASAIRYQYPLYLAPPGDNGFLAKPLGQHLSECLEAIAPAAEQARILKDNLPFVERYLRQRVDAFHPVDARSLFTRATVALREHLGLDEDNQQRLDADLDRLAGHFAEGARLLGYGPCVSLYLLVHAVDHRRTHLGEEFRRLVDKRIQGLRSLLEVEKAKSADTSLPDNMQSSVGPGSRHFDAGALSGMLGQREQGSVRMSSERRDRIERALTELEAWQNDKVLVRFVGQIEDPSVFEPSNIEFVESDEPCAAATDLFEEHAKRFARLFAAMRIATLEIDDGYNPSVHDSWFGGFDWQAFSDEEMQLVTPVVALVSADYLAGTGLPSFSRLLGSRLPVHVLSWVRAYDNPGATTGDDPFDAYRFELAYFGIGHRQVVVAQTSSARHEDLLSGFLCALESNRTSLHLINRGTQTKVKQPLLDAWFVASAALESRAHPFILVNPDAGDHASERVSFGGNPQAGDDWPVEKLEYRDADGNLTEMNLAFTFADYALLMPALHAHFRSVPKGVESEALVPVDQFLEQEQIDGVIPFIWGIDDEGILVRLVVSRALVFACRDRLNYWRTLQELAGIHNFYVEEAIDRVIEEQRVALEAEREQLRKDHEEQLENVRTEAADGVMGQLVDVLMGADLSDIVTGTSPLASMPSKEPEPPSAEPATEETEPTPPQEADEEVSFDEPWLDTAMCTTCDDCMGINKMMFAYNEDKQAIITDPRAGGFADLVAAAEICPAKCIHPGKPLDPNEPDLDELIARAEPFN